ncbi:MAG TPA: dihydrolipoamide acetyltransferase family protein [Jatrophihabitans sp.]|uniref:dihydrolipoamide acetyltransferase family protein n=1 Tax=Jatrophihabitans sp. TaxID=1932789 RepID=UPI002DFAE361|nr:dihydrolipoamide acetyltransferase family protein [Jatrophihabitans sp.]
MPDFLLPDLGEGLDAAEVVTWRVQVGDRVEVDQIVVEVETAKAAVEVPIPFAGQVARLHADAGQTVSVGRPLITVDAEVPAGFREPGVTTPEPTGEESSGNVLIGYGTSAAPRRARRGSRRTTGPVAAPVPAATPTRSGPVPVISPLVRKLARDAGVDLHAVTPTGPCGLVRRHDVEQLLNTPASATASPDTRIPLRGRRRVMADALSRSRREIPEATVWVDVDATELLAARRVLNARDAGRPVSLLALLARFAVLALSRYPELNARVDADEIVLFDHVHLGFAAQTDRGLVVPVVRDAQTLSTRDLSAALASRTAAARAGTLAPADLTGGTFTVNNYGVFGVDGSAAIINHPEVAILGIGRIIDRPWVVDGELTVRKVSQLTLAFDHRACDGGTAGGFLRYVADCVEAPITALGEL